MTDLLERLSRPRLSAAERVIVAMGGVSATVLLILRLVGGG